MSILLNSAVCDHAPDLITAARNAGCEFIAHGYSNSDALAGMSEPKESAYVADVASQIAASIGTRPLGWARRAKPLSVPNSQEINDSSTIIGRQASATSFAQMTIDQFDEMRATPGDEPLVTSVILHSFISGQPFRWRALRRAVAHIAHASSLWITQPRAIARHHAEVAKPG